MNNTSLNPESEQYDLGLDTGGTYTDAVLMNAQRIVCVTAKSRTTHAHLLTGLQQAVSTVVEGIDPRQIRLVSLSTTLATNALVESRGRSIALLLIGYSEQQLARARLQESLRGDPYQLIAGGHTATGDAVCELDLDACKDFVSRVDDKVDAYAVSAVFAVRNPEHEVAVQQLLERISGKPVSCAYQLSSDLDAPRRALTAVLNARLIPMIKDLIDAARRMLSQQSITAPLMIVKGDGSLVSADFASRCPVETILSGPAASVVGAGFLFGKNNMVVADMGGTTTDLAVMHNDQPLLSSQGAMVGGWRTMVKALDVQSVGLGGDSTVFYDTRLREFDIDSQRVIPLSLLASEHPQVLGILQQQLDLPLSTTHSALFVIRQREAATGLSAQQSELFEQISTTPLAIQSLFEDQSVPRALLKLEEKGFIIRAGFTPTDASHLLDIESTGNRQAAELGAALLMRYCADNLGQAFDSARTFASHIRSMVARKLAMAAVQTAFRQLHGGRGLSDEQSDLLLQSLHQAQAKLAQKPLVSTAITLHSPLAALGAPSPSYFPATAVLLNTSLLTHQHSNVANAIGAVVGVIRQEVLITLLPAGGQRVKVLLADGVREYDSLEEGAEVAEAQARSLVSDKARDAGAVAVSVSCVREDNQVTDGGSPVYLGSRVTAIAIGRPPSR